jgi:hypothetical protein
MLRHPLRLVAASLAALLLAACQVTVQPIPFEPDLAGTVSAQDTTNPSPRAFNVAVQPGATLYFRVDVPTARDLLYGEAVGATGLRVRWLNANGTTLAVSESPAYFAGDVQALEVTADASALDPSTIAVQFNCDGPCVAIAPTASTYYLSVHNRANSPRSFDLYAYTFAANDLNDRGANSNQTASSAVTFSGPTTLSGAIELVGDRDWFAYTGNVTRVLEFSPLDLSLDLRLRFEPRAGFPDTELTGAPGDRTTNLVPGDRFQVYSASGRAGPSGTSGYFIEIQD